MKKKLFTLMTLAVTGIMGAWAQSTIPVSITWNLSDLQTNGIANPTEAVQGNATLTVGSGLSILESTKSYSNIDFMQFQPTGSDKGDNSLASAKNLNKYIDFTFTPSAEFTMTKVEFDAVKIGTGDPQIFIEVIDGSSSITVAGATDIRRNQDSDTENNIHQSHNVNTSASTNALTLRIYVGKLANDKQVGLANVVIEGNMVDTSAPSISVSNVNINATENGVAATQTIDVTGDNLTGTTLTATLGEDAPEGLSINPANAEIKDGSINTSFTLSYTATENASGTTTLTFSDGETSKTVTVTYYAEVAEEWTLQDVTGYIKWNFSDKADGATDLQGTDGSDFQVYANIAADRFKSTFDGTKLSGKTTSKGYFIRVNNNCAQDITLKFHTTVPGAVKVSFSHTSGSASDERYINVNGVDGIVMTGNTTKTEETFYVSAGDVVIDGHTKSVRIYEVEFTPATSEEIEITCEGGLASYTTTYPLDFTESDATAYIVKKADNAAAYLTEVKKVPAGIGIIVMGTKGEKVSIPVTSEETDDVNGNLLEGVTAAEGYTVSEEEPVYALSKTDGLLHPVTANTTIPQGKAYLPASALGEDVNPSRGISLVIGNGDDDGTTNITGVEAKKFIENNKFYNLNGQEVQNPTKGLYIVNGKKVIIK